MAGFRFVSLQNKEGVPYKGDACAIVVDTPVTNLWSCCFGISFPESVGSLRAASRLPKGSNVCRKSQIEIQR